MKTILVANQKGGVGKSTIAEEITFGLRRRGFKVAFTNLDNQGGNIIESRTSEPDDDVQVVDTPGSLNEDFQEWCRAADLVLIPTMPSEKDREVLERCWKLAKTSGTKAEVGVVVNCCNIRNVVDRDFIEYIKGKGMTVFGTIPRTEAMKKAQAAHRSVVEFDKSSSTSLAFGTLDFQIRHALGMYVEAEKGSVE